MEKWEGFSACLPQPSGEAWDQNQNAILQARTQTANHHGREAEAREAGPKNTVIK